MADLSFTVDSSLLRELGEKLVETVHLALVELVKNSYDADATTVQVIFEKDGVGGMTIKIIDNGTGMNFDAVQNYWMRIATTTKEENNLSPIFGRPLAGSKGIGRFSCRRLGNKLKMTTLGSEDGRQLGRQATLQKTVVEFPWANFKPGTNVTEINCPGNQIITDDGETGTTLIISEVVEDEWTTRGYNWLKRQMAVLVANRGEHRNEFEPDPGFSITLIAPDFSEEVVDLRDNLMDAGWGTLSAHIGEDHKAECTLDAMGIGRKTITSRGSFPLLKDIRLKLAVMVDDRQQMRDTTVLSKTTLKAILDDWGGVQVRYHGFRVSPYGNDDWLSIDKERGLRRGTPSDELSKFAKSLRGVDPSRSLLNMLSMKSYMGNVEIGGGASGFEMKVNREGFLSSKTFDELREFVRYTIDWATIYRDYYIRNKIQKEAEISLKTFAGSTNRPVSRDNLIETAMQVIGDEFQSLAYSLPPKEKARVVEVITTATAAISKHEKSNKEELAHLRLVASASTLVLIFSHEVNSLLGEIETSKTTLLNTAARVAEPHRQNIILISERLTSMKNRFQELLKLTSLLGTSGHKAKPMQIDLKERIIESVRAFQLILKTYEIQIDYNEVPNNITISNILESEVLAIVLNTLSNSIKSVIAAGGDKKIKFMAFRDKGMTVIRILDNGLGIDPSNYEDVFIPFLADPENNLYDRLEKALNPQDSYAVGTGGGLGLSIIREIIAARGGRVQFRAPDHDWKAELEITLP